MSSGSSLYQEGGTVAVEVDSVLTVQSISASGVLVIDYSAGKHVILTLTGNITDISFTGWPADGLFARLTIEIHNTGAFGITGWPPLVKWAGSDPIITQGIGAEDWLAITTSTAGAAMNGHIVGQNYT